jgi:hypothetical protein
LNVQQLTRRVAAFGLPGHHGPLLEPDAARVPLSPADWDALVGVAQHQRLTGYLHAAVEAGALPATPAQGDELAELHLAWCSSVVRLEQHLLDLEGHLRSAGISFLVLKGSAAAHLVHADPAARLFGDNDLLFRSEEFDEALALLAQLGYRRPAAPATSAFDRRFGKGATLVGPNGDELDAHRTLVFGTFGLAIELDELFDSAVTFELGGRELLALGPETRLLHACYHAALGDPEPRFSSVRDIAQMLATGPHDPDRVLELARAWRSEAVLVRALRLCRDHLGVEVDSPLSGPVDSYVPNAREERAIDSYVGANRSFAAKVRASLPYLDGVAAKAAFLRAAVFPAAAFVKSRGSQPGLSWIGRGLRSLARRGKP